MNLANEPVLAAGGLAGLVGAILVLLASFGVRITEDQQKAILAVITLAVPIIAAVWARSRVVPVSKIDEVPLAKRALEQAEAKLPT